MHIFNDEIAEDALMRLGRLSDGTLTDFRYEFQDGFKVILITCNLSIEPNTDLLNRLRQDIEQELGPAMPANRNAPSWMVNIYFNNALVESVIGL
jgi:hypothetical protein